MKPKNNSYWSSLTCLRVTCVPAVVPSLVSRDRMVENLLKGLLKLLKLSFLIIVLTFPLNAGLETSQRNSLNDELRCKLFNAAYGQTEREDYFKLQSIISNRLASIQSLWLITVKSVPILSVRERDTCHIIQYLKLMLCSFISNCIARANEAKLYTTYL